MVCFDWLTDPLAVCLCRTWSAVHPEQYSACPTCSHWEDLMFVFLLKQTSDQFAQFKKRKWFIIDQITLDLTADSLFSDTFIIFHLHTQNHCKTTVTLIQNTQSMVSTENRNTVTPTAIPLVLPVQLLLLLLILLSVLLLYCRLFYLWAHYWFVSGIFEH